MSLIIRQPTANETPDATLGGLAVTTPSNTGHASTNTQAAGGATETKSCRWFSFQSVGGQITAITLKIDHTSSGALVGSTPANTFRLQYSLNNGGAWTTAVERLNFMSPQGPTTFSAGLSAAQNVSQVQVRVLYSVATSDVSDEASVTATIANIQLEVTIEDTTHLLSMM